MCGIVGIGTDKHIASEQGLPCGCGNHLHRQVVVAVLTHMQVLYPRFRLIGMGLHSLPQGVEAVRIEGSVDATPVDRVFTRWLSHDETVCGRASGSRSGLHAQCAGIGQDAFAPCQCHVDQFRRGESRMNSRGRKGSFAHVVFRAEYLILCANALLFFFRCLFGILISARCYSHWMAIGPLDRIDRSRHIIHKSS